jgi:hypothetical protein
LTGSLDSRLYVALVHYPVIDKNGETIASAVTNLDLHDIARVCRTYGVKGYFVITPLADQKILVNRIVDHWVGGAGGRYNPKRKNALELVHVRDTFGQSIDEIAATEGRRPLTVVTTARRDTGGMTCQRLREMIESATPVLLVFGTAWGLTDDFMARADHILEPLAGTKTYNHLSVRSAAAIVVDRLLGR